MIGFDREVVRRRHQVFFEGVAGDADPHLRPAVGGALHDPEREIVEQLVGEDDAAQGDGGKIGQRRGDRPEPGGDARVGIGAFVQRAERVLDRLERQHVALLGAAGVGALDQHVAQRRRAPRLRGEHIGGQAPTARARLDHEERIARAEIVPAAIERPPDQGAEERAGLGAGDEVATRSTGSVVAGEEAAVAVERLVDEGVERDRPTPMDPLSDAFRDRGAHRERTLPIRAARDDFLR